MTLCALQGVSVQLLAPCLGTAIYSSSKSVKFSVSALGSQDGARHGIFEID